MLLHLRRCHVGLGSTSLKIISLDSRPWAPSSLDSAHCEFYGPFFNFSIKFTIIKKKECTAYINS